MAVLLGRCSVLFERGFCALPALGLGLNLQNERFVCMQSPFKIFRKHQRVVLAALTLMAMIAFGLGDTLMKWGRVGGSQPGTKNVVETNIGNLSQAEMQRMVMNRRAVHRFIGVAFQKSHPELEKNQFGQYFVQSMIRRYGFGGTSQIELLYTWLHRHEARKMGIVVSDKQIEDYIDRFTERKLSTRLFKEIVDDMRLGPKELFDIFREELQADIAMRMKAPFGLPSPEKYWEYYQQLNTREEIEVATVPVKDFTDEVADPTEKEIAALFEKGKNDFEQAGDGEFKPGFRQPRKVKLHYLTLSATAIDDKLAALGPVSEKEIDEYYERNKDKDSRLHEVEQPARDEAPIEPPFAPEKGPTFDSEPGDKPQDKSEGQPETPDAAPKTKAEKPESKDETPEPQDDKPESKSPPEKGAEKESGCSAASVLEDDAQEPAPAKTDKSDAAEEDLKKPELKTTADDGADDKPNDKKDSKQADDAGATPERDNADADKSAGDESKKPGDKAANDKADSADDLLPKIGKGVKKFAAAPKIKYKPLDDNLRDLIRESVIQERRQKIMKEQSAKALAALRDVGLKFATSADIKLTEPNSDELKRLEQMSQEAFRQIADDLGMRFDKTGLVSQQELSEIPGLGKAVEVGANDSPRVDPTTIIEQAFGSEALCRVLESETLDGNKYVWWKVLDAPAHVPRLDELGLRDQVVKAWKRLQALPLAKQRAEELAAQVRQANSPMAEVLGDEKITKDPKSLSVTVARSKEFSFYQDSSVPNAYMRNQGPSVQLGNPIVVDKAGRKFMQVVFKDLSDGEVGVALNDDASVYYVVKVTSRRPADRDAFKDAAIFGQSSPYGELAQIELGTVMRAYYRRIDEKYAVKWNDLSAYEMGPMGDDD